MTSRTVARNSLLRYPKRRGIMFRSNTIRKLLTVGTLKSELECSMTTRLRSV